ncbi:enoyl-CoA hydratase [Rhodococcus sp. SRB_17]|uniref:enoyl-CoA hydratase/isomerase family protein n=1 Tax=Rhodococcus sp. OK302 TaxID=1882769 RepID=UPI000B9455C9|nr:enoyl-CoA hydratase-related protein [Rhodococcus sp. OK302]NMM89095.1 enoyl-CoA hydratase [Rhodococcus sp. SRB_17]OYD66933.1 enoyl-CoA hydratase/carnithine racemase [Rhodococcus sp. OK302]
MSAVEIERNGAVATIVLDRPDRRNALDLDSWVTLRKAVLELQDDPLIRAVILTGAGGTFCAGADLGSRGALHPLDRMRIINATAIACAEFSKPLIAKVEGFAVGAGWNLALLCDFVVASKDAKFSQIFSKRGLSVDFGGSWLLPRLVGLQQAKRLVMLAETIDAREAFELGLVTYLVDAEELDVRTRALAERLADGPPAALSQSAAMLEHHTSLTLREALDNEARAQAVNFATDATDAVRAFVEKREPVFTGGWAVPGVTV